MILGIDLGTKNSLIGYYDDGVKLVENCFESYLTPSVVHIEENGNIIVGQLAAQRLLTHPDSTFEMFKRKMGESKKYCAHGKCYSATQLSSFILESLVNDFKEKNDCEIEGVVISVPAYFNENQRHATKLAGQLIDLNVIQILNEPSAAALYASQLAGDFDKSLILDLGGGTFDLTVVECFESVYEILSIAGDTNLGGQDYTNALVDICTRKLGVEPSAQLHEMCENQKRNLVDDNSKITINYQEKSVTITFDEFYKEIEEINDKILPIFHKAVQDAKIHDINEIKKIVFIGGGSKQYAFRKYIYTLLSASEENEVFDLDDDCDLTVINGVVLYTGTLDEENHISDIILTDVCPFTLGVAVHDEHSTYKSGAKFQPLISRNATLPTSKTFPAVPIRDNQRQVRVKVYQGESLDVDKNLFLGEVIIPCKSEKDLIITKFTYDINSILKINVVNLAMNIEKEEYIHHDKELSEKNKKELVKELVSLQFLDRRKQKQEYYLEKLNYHYEHGSIEGREFCNYLMERYVGLIENGTHKEMRMLEMEIDEFLGFPINFTLNGEDFVS